MAEETVNDTTSVISVTMDSDIGVILATEGKYCPKNIKVTPIATIKNTADADAAAGNIVSGKSAYVNGFKVTGSMQPITVSNPNSAICDTSNSDATSSDIVSGKIAYVNGSKITGTALLKKEYTWHQCPAAVKSFLDSVTYDPSDYTVSSIADYAPATAVSGNTKPVGKTVDGVTYYNEVPNTDTPFSSANEAGTVKPLDRLRWINSATSNVRDLGGWACDGGTVKYGMLFRGGECDAADKDLMVNQCGVRHELQLRGTSEAPQNYSLWGVDYTCPEEYMWYDISDKTTWAQILKCVFDCVNHNKALYFHCAGGLDRTGTVACILEAILGMSQSDIDKDYEIGSFAAGISNTNSDRKRNGLNWSGDGSAADLNVRGLITQINALTVGNTFRDKVINWVATMGFTADEINTFRSQMIDGTPGTISLELSDYDITNTLTNVANNNTATAVDQYQGYEANITPADGYVISAVSVLMGGVDITAQAFEGRETTLNRSVSSSLNYCSISNSRKRVIDGQGYVADLSANDDYTMDGATVTITMGGVDVSTYYSNGKIAIPNVIGDIVIIATAVQSAPAYTNLADPTSADFKDQYRINSSGNDVAAAGHFICNKIPLTKGHILRIKGIQTPLGTDNPTTFSSDGITEFSGCDTMYSLITYGHATYDAENHLLTYEAYITYTGSQMPNSDSVAYYRGSFVYAPGYTKDTIIITVDEEIA